MSHEHTITPYSTHAEWNPTYGKALMYAELAFRDVNGYMPDEENLVVYLAGPMSWKPKFNFPTFDAASKDLRECGFVVISPAELDHEKERADALASPDGDPSNVKYAKPWIDCLKRDLQIVTEVDGVVVLPGWEKSKGALWETFTAYQCGKWVAGVYPDMLDIPAYFHPYQLVEQPDWAIDSGLVASDDYVPIPSTDVTEEI